ncbi:hypothetical protein [Bacillus sp. V2I10]|uniref:hypothetical protein n=1 Tax=Bacillus sp. V2I10 TaxID=3042276 RepID=UPI002789F4FE|nr:hypothetical protein [Bacillus sp. V2I10]MDQ0862021.1 hypothetical protein [Bacillus sp. V2I10]
MNGQIYLTINGIFHAIKDVECYNCKLIVHLDNKNRKNLTDMILLNVISGFYESVKGYNVEVGDAITDIAINHVYLKKIA